MEESVRQLLWRNVIDLHRRRDLLKAHGVPIRRGVILYGPPGTGKTFASRYLCAQLPDTTRIVVAGSALQQVAAIFALARLLQPSLVILEDVDLVFTTRDINVQGSILGERLDQMDGLRPHEDVGFVLTTNAIDRIEAAIKDRPGRISQCIHMGPPGRELRRRYLAHSRSGRPAARAGPRPTASSASWESRPKPDRAAVAGRPRRRARQDEGASARSASSSTCRRRAGSTSSVDTCRKAVSMPASR
jgi:SpoVK/Ycf46/Vps4 family AAA+-type ATPase